MMPIAPFEPKATFTNYGPHAESFWTRLWITENLRLFDSFENPILNLAANPGEITSLELFTEKTEDYGRYQITPATREITDMNNPLGDFGDWFAIDWDGDGTTFSPDGTHVWSPDTAVKSPGNDGFLGFGADDELRSPTFDLGTNPILNEFVWYQDVVDPDGGDYLIIWAYDGSWSGWAISGIPYSGWWTIGDWPLGKTGSGFIGFEFVTDGDGLTDTIWLDDIQVTSDVIVYDQWEPLSLPLAYGAPESAQVTYPEFTPDPNETMM
jgi:hypothetical protein